MRNYREYIREAIKTPLDDFNVVEFGRWAILNREQRKLIGRLLDEMDSSDTYIKELYLKNQQLKDKINKAIEMIEKMTEKELNDITYKGKHYLVCGSDFGEGADIILDILKGDKE